MGDFCKKKIYIVEKNMVKYRPNPQNPMKANELLHIRKTRGLTREQLAVILGKGGSPSAIEKWEKGERSIPQWVEDKLLSEVPITLPLCCLGLLLKSASEKGIDFSTYLADIIRREILPPSPPAIGEDPDDYKPKK
jgi:transcriptional regulator with XRE-family HTH domain